MPVERFDATIRRMDRVTLATLLVAVWALVIGAAVWAIRRIDRGPTTTDAEAPAAPTPDEARDPDGAPPTPQPTRTVTATKTLRVPAGELYRAIADDEERTRWMPDDDLREVAERPQRWVRFTLDPDDGRVTMSVTAKADGRSTITIRHAHIRTPAGAELAKAHWRACLADLAAHLAATAADPPQHRSNAA